jgi:regulator of protease activity HflC (stomatin/prohibitin superfamily)
MIFIGVVIGLVATGITVQLLLAFLRALGAYVIVRERSAHVYMLFGRVACVLDQPGLHCLWLHMGPRAPLARLLGRRYVIDLRLDQNYLRSQPVNSEEGAPMGIGIWYEMAVTDAVAFLFKNTDPRGSLRTSVSNAVVRCLSNMKLGDMLESRHAMSRAVRAEVSPQSEQWGYQLGSIYVRKVHFRDGAMIRQIEEKVVNRLRQVTSAIRQDGANQVSIITGTAEREASIEFAKATAMRPQIVGKALGNIAGDPEVLSALFEILETQKLVEGGCRTTIVPRGEAQPLSVLMSAVAAAAPRPAPPPTPPHSPRS